MKTITINNREFEVIGASTKQGQDIIETYHHWTKDWNELYKNPSQKKVLVKWDWEQFFGTMSIFKLGYRGNGFVFSIYAKDDKHYFHITADHNYVVCTESNQSYNWNCLNIGK